jgi:hypothetical protein
MNERRFDDIARSIGVTRRVTLGWLSAGLGLLVAAAPGGVGAKKRKRKKKRKNEKIRCFLNGHTCSPSAKNDCCALGCCLWIGEPEGGEHRCTSSRNTCCTADEGGGACTPEYPVCCPDSTCGRTEEECLLGLHDSAGRGARITHRG